MNVKYNACIYVHSKSVPTVAVKKTFPKLVHRSQFELHSSFTIFTSFTHRSLYPVIRMLFTNDCRSCFPVQDLM